MWQKIGVMSYSSRDRKILQQFPGNDVLYQIKKTIRITSLFDTDERLIKGTPSRKGITNVLRSQNQPTRLALYHRENELHFPKNQKNIGSKTNKRNQVWVLHNMTFSFGYSLSFKIVKMQTKQPLKLLRKKSSYNELSIQKANSTK